MPRSPYHNRESFIRAVDRMLARADCEGRGEDLDRVVAHVVRKPREVSSLASLMLLLDEDYRLLLQDEIDAFRRWGKQKGQHLSDDDIFAVMMTTYEGRRSSAKLEGRA
jgi:hypothetical protein